MVVVFNLRPPPRQAHASKDRYGAEPVITYFETPVIVDNAVGEITSDA